MQHTHTGLLPGKVGLKQGCAVFWAPRKGRGHEALRTGSMRDSSSHPALWVSNLALQPGLSSCWLLSFVLVDSVSCWWLAGVLGRGFRAGLSGDACAFSVGSAPYSL